MSISVNEITMAAPDIICVEIYDEEIIRGNMVHLDVPDSSAYGTWRLRTNTGKVGDPSEWCRIVGLDKDWLHFQDLRPTNYLDRAAADVAANWSVTGGPVITAVYRKSVLFDQAWNGGTAATSGSTSSLFGAARLSHKMYLKLASNLTPGSYTINLPAGVGISAQPFVFNDRVTRSCSIHVQQFGVRNNDKNKLGYLSVWIPGFGTEGRVDLSSYGLTKFYVLNEAGNVVSSALPIVLRTDPTTADTLAAAALYASTTQGANSDGVAAAITAITKADPCNITVAGGHTLTNGENILLLGIGGMNQLEAFQGKVSNLSGNAFDLQTPANVNVNSTAFTTYTNGTFLAPYSDRIMHMQTTNRAGTYVFGLDFSNVDVPKFENNYRLWIPGLGVSFPFRVHSDSWHGIAQGNFKGMYNARQGCAIDGTVGGFTRPVGIKNGAHGMTLFKSQLPFSWWNESGLITTTPFNSIQAGGSPWITSTVTDAWGGHQDAGDWDVFIAPHGQAYFEILDVLDIIPASARNTRFNIPKSSTLLDPAIYSEIDTAPDAIHEVIWGIDWYRRLQDSGGSIPGGMEGAESQGTFLGAPSWLALSQWYTFGTDHYVTFVFCGLAAKLSRMLSDFGYPNCAATWAAAAQKAWDFAENIYSNQTARDAFFLNAKTLSGWSDPTYTTNMTALQGHVKDEARLFAAAMQFRLTGNTTYKTIIDDSFTSGWPSYFIYAGFAAREYYKTPGADSANKATIRAAVISTANTRKSYSEDATTPYRHLNIAGGNLLFGGGGPGCFTSINVIYAHQYSMETVRDDSYLSVLQSNLGHVLGANQMSTSLTRGLGSRVLRTHTHDDGWVTSQSPPDGYTPYGWAINGGLFGSVLNGSSSVLSFLVDQPQADSDFMPQRAMWPTRWAYPVWDEFIQNRFNISVLENTITQTTGRLCAVALYLHGWDGNSGNPPIAGHSKIGRF